MKEKTNHLYNMVLLSGLVFVATFAALLLFRVSIAAAATIEVNSTNDTSADDGECTLREAITAANDDSASGAASGECAAGNGADTINFDISGTPSFINAGENGYTLELTSALPDITATLIINGYSQNGAQPNTNPAPQALNARLLIAIDGTNAGNTEGIDVKGDNSTVRGLIITNFTQAAAIGVGADNLTVQGNYLGTNPTGLQARGNKFGLAITSNSSTDTLIGGLDPEDRNLVAGNLDSGITPNGDSHNWTIQVTM